MDKEWLTISGLTAEYKPEVDTIKEWKLPWDKIKDSSFTFTIDSALEEKDRDAESMIVVDSKSLQYDISEELLEDMVDNAVLLVLAATQETAPKSPKEKQEILRKCIREGIQAAIANPIEEKRVAEYVTLSVDGPEIVSWAEPVYATTCRGSSSFAEGYDTIAKGKEDLFGETVVDSLGRRRSIGEWTAF